MAIKMDVDFVGVPVKDAYLAIDDQFLALSKGSMRFSLLFHASEGSAPFKAEQFECAYDLEAGNPFEQAYAYLKTLPEFEGATDY